MLTTLNIVILQKKKNFKYSHHKWTRFALRVYDAFDSQNNSMC